MRKRITRRSFGISSAVVLAAPALVRRAHAASEPLRLRLSVDSPPTHMRNISLKDYIEKVERASGGKIRSEVFESGQLYPDLEVAKALIQGQIEMAVPGTWAITGMVSDADFLQLPALYGRSMEDAHRVIDGKPGQLLNRQIQQKLRSHVLGPYLDLGFQNWYSVKKPIGSLADLKGMKIRNSGGAGQAWRARFLGAIRSCRPRRLRCRSGVGTRRFQRIERFRRGRPLVLGRRGARFLSLRFARLSS